MSTANSLKIDLHCHTHHSDGELSVIELINRAHNMQVDVLAITDHDTVAGYQQAVDYQKTLRRPLQLVTGVELSTRWHGFEIHILGLNVNVGDALFQQRLAQQQLCRELRAEKIADRLEKAGFSGCLEEAKAMAGVGQLSRVHFAKTLLKNGHVRDIQHAFDLYLGRKKRAYVKPQWVDMSQAISWITEAGGQAVLAHPCAYDMTTKWLRRLLKEMNIAGAHGMEVAYGNLDAQRRKLLAELAREYNLNGSVGSDFHGPGRWVELGKNLSLPEGIVPIWKHWELHKVVP